MLSYIIIRYPIKADVYTDIKATNLFLQNNRNWLLTKSFCLTTLNRSDTVNNEANDSPLHCISFYYVM